jgi:hypothetical protein
MRSFLKRLRSRGRKILGISKKPKVHRDLKDRFTYVYQSNAWGSSNSVSGPGSDLQSGSVRQSNIALSQVLRDYDIQSIADVPCGDFNWMPHFLAENPQLKYTGYDIVPMLIKKNQNAHKNRRFILIDITRTAPERVDLLFSKDLVNHLLERDVWRAVANMVRSRATYVMITSNAVSEANEELMENFGGASRTLNLQTAPFNFPPPLYDDGYLAMWRTSDLSFVLSRVQEI